MRALELDWLKDIIKIAEDCERRSQKGVRKPLKHEDYAYLVEDLIRLKIAAKQLGGLLKETPETDARILRGEKAERILREFARQAEIFTKGEQ